MEAVAAGWEVSCSGARQEFEPLTGLAAMWCCVRGGWLSEGVTAPRPLGGCYSSASAPALRMRDGRGLEVIDRGHTGIRVARALQYRPLALALGFFELVVWQTQWSAFYSAVGRRYGLR